MMAASRTLRCRIVCFERCFGIESTRTYVRVGDVARSSFQNLLLGSLSPHFPLSKRTSHRVFETAFNELDLDEQLNRTSGEDHY